MSMYILGLYRFIWVRERNTHIHMYTPAPPESSARPEYSPYYMRDSKEDKTFDNLPHIPGVT